MELVRVGEFLDAAPNKLVTAESTPLRVCQVVASINRDIGGPAVTVPRLASSLVEQGVACRLVTLDYSNLGPQTPAPNVELLSLPAGWWTKRVRGWSPSLRSRLLSQAPSPDLIHNHGLWMFPNLYARQAALQRRRPAGAFTTRDARRMVVRPKPPEKACRLAVVGAEKSRCHEVVTRHQRSRGLFLP